MTTFIVIGLAGLGLLLVSLLVGDLFDGALDALAGDVFSGAVVGAFVAATGFGAAAAQGAVGTAAAVPVGLVTGLAFAWFAWWLTRLLRDGGSDSTPTTDDTIGRDARVVTPIPADGLGVVDVLVGGHVMRLNARAEQPIEPGTPVHVTSVLSPTSVTVAPVWPELP
jgi:membrane-bound ClpP family serine protease